MTAMGNARPGCRCWNRSNRRSRRSTGFIVVLRFLRRPPAWRSVFVVIGVPGSGRVRSCFGAAGGASVEPVSPQDLTRTVLDRHAGVSDVRLKEIITALIAHLHAFATEVALTEEEWAAGIRFLTEAGHITDADRQEFILLSDTLGLSMLVDLINHD